MKNLLWILLMGLSASTFAQRYVLFNPVCMERLKYDVINGYGGDSYITYAIELNDQETIYLEVGKESDKKVNRISRAVVTCNSSSFGKNMVNRINNSNSEEYAIVLKQGQGTFSISPVKAAAYLKQSDRGIEYIGNDYAFNYDFFSNSKNDNLANANYGNGRVFFVGNAPYECFNAYTFSVTPQANSNLSTDLTIVPELGVLEHRTNMAGGKGSKRLATVNAKTFGSIVQDRCKGVASQPLTSRPNVNTSPTTRPDVREEEERARGGNTRISTPATTSTPDTRVATNDNDSNYGIIARRDRSDATRIYNVDEPRKTTTTRTTLPATAGIHVVKKGETLYRIAKNNSVSVEQLKAWNNLKNNSIYPGTQLYTSAPGTLVDRGLATTTRPATNTTSTTNNMDWDNRIPEWRKTDGIHVFKRGETVSGVAEMYGYTERRFRDLNGLMPGEVPMIGMRLMTTECNDSNVSVGTVRNDNNGFLADDRRDDNFNTRGASMNDRFDDGFADDFKTSVRTPAPYSAESTSRRILPGSYSDNTYERLSASRTANDYRRAATTNPDPQGISFGGSRPQSHLVRENESLYSIARKYNTTVSRLAELNDLDPREVLLPGQSIFVQ
ncbi:MAG: LysM peptidoglycan-binding domain-containing protein [Bacteroidota bacterium]